MLKHHQSAAGLRRCDLTTRTAESPFATRTNKSTRNENTSRAFACMSRVHLLLCRLFQYKLFYFGAAAAAAAFTRKYGRVYGRCDGCTLQLDILQILEVKYQIIFVVLHYVSDPLRCTIISLNMSK